MWQGELFSPYGHVEVYYKNTDTSYITKRIFFSKGHTKIVLTKETDEAKYFTVDEKSSTNIAMYEAMGGTELKAYTKVMLDSIMRHIYRNRKYFSQDENLLNENRALQWIHTGQQMEFIRSHPDVYVSYWTFLTEMAHRRDINPDTLKALFDEFPATIKTSKSGAHVAEQIRIKKPC